MPSNAEKAGQCRSELYVGFNPEAVRCYLKEGHHGSHETGIPAPSPEEWPVRISWGPSPTTREGTPDVG